MKTKSDFLPSSAENLRSTSAESPKMPFRKSTKSVLRKMCSISFGLTNIAAQQSEDSRRTKSATSKSETEIRTPRGSSMIIAAFDLGGLTRAKPRGDSGSALRTRCSAPEKLAIGIPSAVQKSAWLLPDCFQHSNTARQSRRGLLGFTEVSAMVILQIVEEAGSQSLRLSTS